MMDDQEMLEGYLRNKQLLSECYVLSRADTNGNTKRVLFYVPCGLASSEDVRQAAEESGFQTQPDLFVPITALPRNAQGAVDECQLLNIELASDAFLSSATAAAEAQFNTSSSISLRTKKRHKVQPYHIFDFLSGGWPSSSGKKVQRSLDSQQEDPSSSLALNQPLSVVDGGDIDFADDAPQSLIESLNRAICSQHELVFIESGNTISLSYAELKESASRVTSGLRSQGLEVGQPVVFQLQSNVDFITAFWGCVLGGFIPVPLAKADLSNSSASLENLFRVLELFDHGVVLSDSANTIALAEEIKRRDVFVKALAIDTLLASPADNRIEHQPDPTDIALIVLTSGTTGASKGVPLTHQNLLCRSAASIQMHGFDSHNVSLNWMPLDHVAGIIYFHLRDVYLQCQQIHVATSDVLENPIVWLQLLEQYSVKVTFAPNFAVGLVCDLGSQLANVDLNLSSVELVLNGGESIVAATARKFLQILEPLGLSRDVMCPAWGMSETSSGITYATDFSLETTRDEDDSVSVGCPIPGDSIRIADEQNQPVPKGTIGSLQVKGQTIFSGYYNNVEATAESFTPDGWFITGDLGRLDGDSLTVTGRQKDIIIVNGINYSGPVIENVVEQIPGVERTYTAACAVSDPFQDGRESLAIMFVPTDGVSADLLKQIRTEVVREIGVNPEYLLPFTAEEIPKTSIGKIQRTKLKKQFEAGEFVENIKNADMLMDSRTLPSWFYSYHWQRQQIEVSTESSLKEGMVLIFGRGSFASGLAAHINNIGGSAVEILAADSRLQQSRQQVSESTWCINPFERADFDWLRDQLHPEKSMGCHVLYFADFAHDGQGAEALAQRIQSMVACVDSFASLVSEGPGVELTLITDGAVSIHQDQMTQTGPLSAESAALTTVMKTLRQEQPNLHYQHIDIDLSETEAINSLFKGVSLPLKTRETAWRQGQCYYPVLEHRDVKGLSIPPESESGQIYLITGGLGGIGRCVAKKLLKNGQNHVVLLGRRELINEEDKLAYRSLEMLPGTLEYLVCDITSPASLEQTVQQHLANRCAHVKAIYHLAGNYEEALLAGVSAGHAMDMLSAKVDGLINLASRLDSFPNATLINFSSVSAFMGGSLIGLYGAANQFVETYSQQLMNAGYRCLCIAWSGWIDTGMNRGNTAVEALRAKGIIQLDVARALQSLDVLEQRASNGCYMVGLDPEHTDIQKLTNTPFITESPIVFCEVKGAEQAAELNLQNEFSQSMSIPVRIVDSFPRMCDGTVDVLALERLADDQSSRIVLPKTETEEKLLEIWKQVLNLQVISTEWNFFEIGGQSILATRMVAAIRDAFGVEWSVKEVLSKPTCTLQAQAIDEHSTTDHTKVTIPIQPRQATMPLSSAQNRFWLMYQMAVQPSAYHVTAEIRFDHVADVTQVTNILSTLIQRHESLRTIFPEVDGQPSQSIVDNPEVALNRYSLDANESESDVLAAEGMKPFDLEAGPLIRGLLLETQQGESLLSLTLHHIICDGWSIKVLLHEFAALYQNADLELTPLPAQYIDFAQWQQSQVDAGQFDQQLAYWEKQLDGALTGFALPTDLRRPQVQSFKGGRCELTLPTALSESIKSAASSRNVTLFTYLLTAFKLLLSRYADQTDIVVGTVVANRNYAEVQGLMGCCINPLVLRTQIAANSSFDHLVQQVNQIVWEAMANQEIPFDQLVESLKPPRDTGSSPLFKIAFDLRDPQITEVSHPDLLCSVMSEDLQCAQYDLHLTMEESEQGLVTIWEYSSDLFHQETIERMAANFQNLLHILQTGADRTVERVPLLSSTELKTVTEWGHAATLDAEFDCLHRKFEEQASLFPDRTAVVMGGASLRYSELNQRANGLAALLIESGVKQGDLVAIMLPKSMEAIASVLAILKAGAAFVPIDPAYPADRVSFMIEDSAPSIILTQKPIQQSLNLPSEKVIAIEEIHWDAIKTQHNPPISVSGSDLAYVIYTSGSTGRPKGVLVEHSGWCNVSRAQKHTFGLSSGMKVLQFASFSFDASTFEMAMAWGTGSTLYLGDKQEMLPGKPLETMLATHGIEVVTLPPTALTAMSEANLPELKVITVAGEACPESLVRRWADSCRFFNLYGPTEATIWSSFEECKRTQVGAPPIGKPVPGVELYVADSHLELLPLGMPGELLIGGAGVTRGYLGREELTKEKFVSLPHISKSTLYRSGDLVRYLADGRLEFLGRIDHQVKIRGFRIELEEIEAQIASLEQIKDAIVIARGIGEQAQLLAYYALKSPGASSEDSVRQHLRKHLPDYMVPAHILELESMPLSPTGKIDRKALPDPEQLLSAKQNIVNLPGSKLEEQIAEIWKKILGLQAIDTQQNFFDLGGHSLKMTQVQSELQKLLGYEVKLVELFQYTTIQQLAKYIESRGGSNPEAASSTSSTRTEEKRSGRARMAQLAARNRDSRKRK